MAIDVFSISQGIVRKPKPGDKFPDNSTFYSVSLSVTKGELARCTRRRIVKVVFTR